MKKYLIILSFLLFYIIAFFIETILTLLTLGLYVFINKKYYLLTTKVVQYYTQLLLKNNFYNEKTPKILTTEDVNNIVDLVSVKCYHPLTERVTTHRGSHCNKCGKRF